MKANKTRTVRNKFVFLKLRRSKTRHIYHVVWRPRCWTSICSQSILVLLFLRGALAGCRIYHIMYGNPLETLYRWIEICKCSLSRKQLIYSPKLFLLETSYIKRFHSSFTSSIFDSKRPPYLNTDQLICAPEFQGAYTWLVNLNKSTTRVPSHDGWEDRGAPKHPRLETEPSATPDSASLF